MTPLNGDAKPYPKAAQLVRPETAVRRTAYDRVNRETIRKIRERKATACRCCGVARDVHAHHIVRRGAPWFGQWHPDNIVGLCAVCHMALHAGDETVRKVLRHRLTDDEVAYADFRAYEGYVDDIYWRIRPIVTTGDAA